MLEGIGSLFTKTSIRKRRRRKLLTFSYKGREAQEVNMQGIDLVYWKRSNFGRVCKCLVFRKFVKEADMLSFC